MWRRSVGDRRRDGGTAEDEHAAAAASAGAGSCRLCPPRVTAAGGVAGCRCQVGCHVAGGSAALDGPHRPGALDALVGCRQVAGVHDDLLDDALEALFAQGGADDARL